VAGEANRQVGTYRPRLFDAKDVADRVAGARNAIASVLAERPSGVIELFAENLAGIGTDARHCLIPSANVYFADTG
jgi:hypothetical protein